MNDFYVPQCSHPLLLVNEQALNAIYHGGTLMIDGKPSLAINKFNVNDFSKRYWLSLGREMSIDELSKYVVDKGDESYFLYVKVPCNKCHLCRHKRQVDLVNRCAMEELLYPCPPYFITLTYDDAHLPPHGELHYPDVQKFFKRLRRAWSRKGLDHNIRYVVAGEYGKHTGRAHYHLILYNNPYGCNEMMKDKHYQLADDIFKAWHNCQIQGFDFSQCAAGATSYVAKYLAKPCNLHGHWTKPFVHTSVGKGGIGMPYLRKVMDYYHDNPQERQVEFIDLSGKYHSVNFGSYTTSHLWPSPVRSVNARLKSYYKQLCDNLSSQVSLGMMSYNDAYNLADILRPAPSIIRNRLKAKDCKVHHDEDEFTWITRRILTNTLDTLVQDLSEVVDVPQDYLDRYKIFKTYYAPITTIDIAQKTATIREKLSLIHETL